MKPEYTAKMLSYQDEAHQKLLKDKCVLDAWQFLHSSLVYLRYALITEQLYKDAGKKAVADSNGNPTSNRVEIMGFGYETNYILNKFSMEWIVHISNAMDCLLQYVNASLNLGLKVKNVYFDAVIKQLNSKNFQQIVSALNNMYREKHNEYIRAAYNYSKHTGNIFGCSNLLEHQNGRYKITFPEFRYRGEDYDSTEIDSLIGNYENFIGEYIDVLDVVDAQLKVSSPVNNRLHITELIVDGHSMGKKIDITDITLSIQSAVDGVHIARCWIDNPSFSLTQEVQIFPVHHKIYGQHMGFIKKIEIVQNGSKLGYLELKSDTNTNKAMLDTSVLSYHKYNFVKAVT